MSGSCSNDSIDVASAPLREVRVLAALGGLELFGHERGNIEVYKTLKDLGATVYVGINALDNGGNVGAYLQELGFDVFPLPFSNQWSWQWLKRYPLSIGEKAKAVLLCSKRFRQALKVFRPTHILLGNPLTYSYLSLALAVVHSPLVYRMGDCPPEDSWFNMLWWRLLMRRSSAVVCISEYVRQSAGQHQKRAMHVIYNLAPARLGIKSSVPADCDHDFSKILYVGSIAEHKGLLPLIKAFAQIFQDRSDLKLDIIGGSRYDSDFRSKIALLTRDLGVENHVNLLGYCEDTSPHYRAAALHVAPSLCEEALGNVVVEAKREGTPSIVFPSGGLPEMVRHQVDGYVCHEKSAEALEEAMRWMLADPERLSGMGKAARADFEERFDRERFLQAWAKVVLTAGAMGQ